MILVHGTQTSALSLVEEDRIQCNKEYNGTTWTAGGSLPSYRRLAAGSGTQTSALACRRMENLYQHASEEYDGTSWTAGGNLNTAREALAGSGSGTQTSALAFGGSGGPVTASTEAYDGTSWTTNGSLATARNALAGSRNSNFSFSFWRISSINRNRRIYRWTCSCN
jgi:hypothetical protein